MTPCPPGLFTTFTGARTNSFSTRSFWMKRAARSLPLPGDVLTMISTGRVGVQAVAADAGAATIVIARNAVTKQSRCERNRAPRDRHALRLRFATLRVTGTLLAMTVMARA